MCWFLFVIGLVLAIAGAFAYSYKEYIIINNWEFDGEPLGACLLAIGGVLAAIMLFAEGISWMCGI
mgnify:CR=1 FL=1